MKIMVFTEGTIIMHRGGIGYNREEISRQVVENERTLYDWDSYVPIGNAVEKLRAWYNYGAEILYLTSRTIPGEIESIREVLSRYQFPQGSLLYRDENTQYKDLAEEITPDILVEDDCESIGGIEHMTITRVKSETREKITSIPVVEFGGIDHLPDDINELIHYEQVAGTKNE
jgi:hypothetical protein